MLAPGTTLRTYTLTGLVGRGGMGEVWAASDVRSGEPVALKLLKPGATWSESARERLVREARATRAVQHPAIVPVRDVFEHDGTPVLVMELLRGETLRRTFERERRLPLARAAALLLPVAEALIQAHAAGIAHRDLKPENVFLCSDPAKGSTFVDVRLLDFGVARFYEPLEEQALAPITGLDVLVGTMGYMAPEQALHPAECDQRADVWAFGVTFYEALAGCRPIEGDGAEDTLRQLLVGGITPLEVLAPELPEDVTALVARLLVRHVESRERELNAVVKALARYAKTT
jgi:serine/threonine-protein kinase